MASNVKRAYGFYPVYFWLSRLSHSWVRMIESLSVETVVERMRIEAAF
jgi:hypothetical protein